MNRYDHILDVTVQYSKSIFRFVEFRGHIEPSSEFITVTETVRVRMPFYVRTAKEFKLFLREYWTNGYKAYRGLYKITNVRCVATEYWPQHNNVKFDPDEIVL